MRITIDLPDQLADRLTREATEAGTPLAEYVTHKLARRPMATTPVPLTGAELIEYWTREGVIGSRSDIDDPVEFSRTLRAQSENRHHPPTAP